MVSALERNETLTAPCLPAPTPNRWHFCSILAINVSTQAGGWVTGFPLEGLQAPCSFLWPKLWVPFTAIVCANFWLGWEVRLSSFGNLWLLDSEALWISGYRLNGPFSVKLFPLLYLHSHGPVSLEMLWESECSQRRPVNRIYPTICLNVGASPFLGWPQNKTEPGNSGCASGFPAPRREILSALHPVLTTQAGDTGMEPGQDPGTASLCRSTAAGVHGSLPLFPSSRHFARDWKSRESPCGQTWVTGLCLDHWVLGGWYTSSQDYHTQYTLTLQWVGKGKHRKGSNVLQMANLGKLKKSGVQDGRRKTNPYRCPYS